MKGARTEILNSKRRYRESPYIKFTTSQSCRHLAVTVRRLLNLASFFNMSLIFWLKYFWTIVLTLTTTVGYNKPKEWTVQPTPVCQQTMAGAQGLFLDGWVRPHTKQFSGSHHPGGFSSSPFLYSAQHRATGRIRRETWVEYLQDSHGTNS